MSSERNNMSALVEASNHVRTLGGGRGPVKEQLRIAHGKLRKWFSFNRVRDLFHADERCHVWAEEIDTLRREVNIEEKAARDEFKLLCERIATLEARLGVGSQDPDFYRPQADGLRASVHLDGRVRRTLDQE